MKKADLKINSLIASLRPGGTSKLAFGHYIEKLKKDIIDYSGINIENIPRIVFVHSIKPEVYTVNINNKNYVVYDESYGLLANLFLNTFLKGKDNTDTFLEYIKLCLAISYEYRFLELGSLLSVLYLKILLKKEPYKEKSHENSEFLTYVNILFSISHEVYHSNHETIENFHILVEELNNIIISGKEIDSFILEKIKESPKEHRELFESYISSLPEDRRSGRMLEYNYFMMQFQNDESFLYNQIEEFTDDDLEEYLCDYLAFELVFNLLINKYDLKREDAFMYSLLALWINKLITDMKSDGEYYVKYAKEILKEGMYKSESDIDEFKPRNVTHRGQIVSELFIKNYSLNLNEEKLFNEVKDIYEDRFDDLLFNNISMKYHLELVKQITTNMSQFYKNGYKKEIKENEVIELIRQILNLDEEDHCMVRVH